MEHLHQWLCVSERRVCRVVGQPRSSQCYVSMKVGKDVALVLRMVALSTENLRYGYRRMLALLSREGWQVGDMAGHHGTGSLHLRSGRKDLHED